MNKPAYFSIDNIHINNSPQKRLMIVFKTNPCSKYLEGRKCFCCGYEKHTLGENKPSLLEQYENVKKNIKKQNIKHVDLLSSGSLLDPKQVFFEEFIDMFSELIKENIDSILIEGRSEYFNDKKIKILKKIAGPIKMEYGIGLESWNDVVRNNLIQKELIKNDYVELLRKTKKLDIGVCTYLLYGIPGMSKEKYEKDVILSIEKIFKLYKINKQRGRVALFPVFVPKGSDLEVVYDKHLYKLPEIKELYLFIKRINKLFDFNNYHLFVGLDDEGLSDGLMTSPKNDIENKMLLEIKKFNLLQKI